MTKIIYITFIIVSIINENMIIKYITLYWISRNCKTKFGKTTLKKLSRTRGGYTCNLRDSNEYLDQLVIICVYIYIYICFNMIILMLLLQYFHSISLVASSNWFLFGLTTNITFSLTINNLSPRFCCEIFVKVLCQ